eukprot:CAMPEP_0114993576 /NCGR_PEP_ID=MMETSP0216-20121206/12612_1 /TAXON_ID=223996 /ORGANISM="Protocruzia adherens, Strain Boccale" /LENGTH=236 /DNA_ID=CAMNT_0002357245 /DNA_START=302 /DNA_END=1009 /DNA_ORIENTATION=-
MITDGVGNTPFDIAIELNKNDLVRQLLIYSQNLPFRQVTIPISTLEQLMKKLRDSSELLNFLNNRLKDMSFSMEAPAKAYMSQASHVFFYGFQTSFELFNAKFTQEYPQVFEDENTYNQHISLQVIDLPDICSTDTRFLKAVARYEPHSDIFHSPVLQMILKFKWENFGHQKHVKLFKEYLAFVAAFGFYSAILYIQKEYNYPRVLAAMFLFGLTVYAVQIAQSEIYQLKNSLSLR